MGWGEGNSQTTDYNCEMREKALRMRISENRFKLTKRRIALVVLLLALPAAYVQANVYFRWGVARNITRFITNMGGKSA